MIVVLRGEIRKVNVVLRQTAQQRVLEAYPVAFPVTIIGRVPLKAVE